MVHSRFTKTSYAGLFCAWIALGIVPAQTTLGASAGGAISVTSDYIYRGFTETGGRPAVQLDLHASTNAGTFLGAWGSTRDHDYAPRADYDVDLYMGQRFHLSNAWNVTVTAVDHLYAAGTQRHSNDYQEFAAAISYLDRWTFSIATIPNRVRYVDYHRTGRYPAYVADTSGQWLIGNGFFLTGGVGYYYFTGSDAYEQAGMGYAYGNVGLAYEWHSWRLDVGYFSTQSKARHLFPYPVANDSIAGTLSWRF
ncbi:MAG: hypothetical protein JWN85_1953 [Gammaproteobacteria bacterium]|nr:hypothetical protein [Gammaproteobacteria bacterium]